jgi:hypothetical protein
VTGAEEHPAAALHREIDVPVERLTRLHAAHLVCERGCHACCVDDITVFEVEAALIRQHHAELLSTGRPHPAGLCAFLDEEGACRIYTHRPYVCRTQGLPLRWLNESDASQPVELRDACELNFVGRDITELQPDACWTLGPAEVRLQQLQPDQKRVALRALFAGRSSTSA